MEVYSDTPGLQFYTGNFVPDMKGKNNADYKKRSGFCLETQTYPDSIGPIDEEHSEFAKGRCFELKPGGPSYEHNVIYSFASLNEE